MYNDNKVHIIIIIIIKLVGLLDVWTHSLFEVFSNFTFMDSVVREIPFGRKLKIKVVHEMRHEILSNLLCTTELSDIFLLVFISIGN